MMNMNDMVNHCTNAMGSMMGGGMMLVVLLAIFLIWLIGLGTIGTLIFWGVRRLSKSHA